jgi:hypothetical protein
MELMEGLGVWKLQGRAAGLCQECKEVTNKRQYASSPISRFGYPSLPFWEESSSFHYVFWSHMNIFRKFVGRASLIR